MHHEAPSLHRGHEELEEEEPFEADPEIDPYDLPTDAWTRPRTYRRSRRAAETQYFRLDEDEAEGTLPKARATATREEAEAQSYQAAFRAGEVVEAEAVEATFSPRGAATKRTAVSTPPHTLPSTPASSSSATAQEPLRVKRRPQTPPPRTLYRSSSPERPRAVYLAGEPLAAGEEEVGPQPVARERGRTRTPPGSKAEPPPAAAAPPVRAASPHEGRAPQGKGAPVIPKGEVAAEGATVQAERQGHPERTPLLPDPGSNLGLPRQSCTGEGPRKRRRLRKRGRRASRRPTSPISLGGCLRRPSLHLRRQLRPQCLRRRSARHSRTDTSP